MQLWDPFYKSSQKISLKVEEKTLAKVFFTENFFSIGVLDTLTAFLTSVLKKIAESPISLEQIPE